MNEDSKKIRILAVDDRPILRPGIAGLVADESDMTLVAEADRECESAYTEIEREVLMRATSASQAS